MNEFRNFKLKEGETIRESQVRFQVNINALEDLARRSLNKKILSAVAFYI